MQVCRSQYGEDLAILSRLNSNTGFFLEIGANDGLSYSNTYLFEKLGWTGILVEADPRTAEACKQNRPGSQVCNVALTSPSQSGKKARFYRAKGLEECSGFQISERLLQAQRAAGKSITLEELEVDCLTADQLLSEVGVPADGIDFCTIDVEGAELAVLQGFNLSKWRPKLLIIENAFGYPDFRMLSLLHRHGYHWATATGVNDWFVPRSGSTARERVQELLALAYFLLVRTPLRLLSGYIHLMIIKLKGLRR